jgi:hypothetical protein
MQHGSCVLAFQGKDSFQEMSPPDAREADYMKLPQESQLGWLTYGIIFFYNPF